MKKIIITLSLLCAILITSGCNEKSSDVKISAVSHRGERDFAPQNTVGGVKLAFELGAELTEVDFYLTKEGQMVCVHCKPTLKETWGIDKNPSDITLEDVKNSKLANPKKYDAKFANEKLPLIDDIFAVIPKDKRFELEIKGAYNDKFADKVEQARIKAGLDYDNIIITCFEIKNLKDFKARYPKYKTQYNTGYWRNKNADELIAQAKDAGISEIAFGDYRKIDRAFVKKLQDAGFNVSVWQVQNLEDLAYATKLGANRVCSDHAYKLRQNYKLIKSLDFK